MNVLSLFDGISCCQQALNKAGIQYDKYYASEIDKHAMKATMCNYPDTIQLGSVTECQTWDIDWKSIGLIVAGSPCQGFSFAGKQLAFDDERSKLFFEFVNILLHIQKFNPDVKYLLENVYMKEEHEKVITNILGVAPIKINSALLSAQSRKRNYWTNLGMQSAGLFGYPVSIIKQPKDKGILLKHILQLESEVDEKYYLSDKMLKYFVNITKVLKEKGNGFKFEPVCSNYEGKSKTISTKEGGRVENNFIKVSRDGRAKKNQNKSDCFTPGGNSGGNHSDMDLILLLDNYRIRRLTPIEVCRLQTISDNYFFKNGKQIISDSQIYKSCGNGFTVDVIAHILNYIK
jgi:DNA (cytosine-5)-methyltransferase 3A